MSTDNKPVPFLSDAEVYGNYDRFGRSNGPEVGMGVTELRSLYEAELQRLRSLLDEARGALCGMLDQFEHWEGAGGEGSEEDAKAIKAARKALRKLQLTK